MFKIDDKFLKEIREELGYKKTDFTKSIGTSLTSVTNWEGGFTTPGPKNQDLIIEYIRAYGYSGPCVISL